MLIYGVVIGLVGVMLLGGTGGLIIALHRRTRVPYALLTVGLLTYMLALLVQVAALRGVGGWLGIAPVGALAVGLAAGFAEEFARLLGYQFLARGAVTRPQAMMIGLGHGLSESVYTGLVAAGLGLSLLGYGRQRPDDLTAVTSGALAEALNGLLPLVMHMALSWLVLQVFLRGEIGWLFGAIFLHAVAEMMAALLGPEAGWAVAAWRVLIALISLGLLARVRPPAPPR